MRPSVFLSFFSAIVLTLLVFLATDRPARADGPDAGIQGGAATSPIKLEVPTPKTAAPPDALEHPAEAVSAVTETYQHSGLWASVMLALWIILQAAGKKTGPGSLLGDGRVAAAIAAGGAFAGSGVDVLTLHPPNGLMVLATTLCMGIALVLSPHVKHDA